MYHAGTFAVQPEFCPQLARCQGGERARPGAAGPRRSSLQGAAGPHAGHEGPAARRASRGTDASTKLTRQAARFQEKLLVKEELLLVMYMPFGGGAERGGNLFARDSNKICNRAA